ncbi:MAG: hypothetical protein RLZZ292_2343, partial [Bacteroidota bacterium]
MLAFSFLLFSNAYAQYSACEQAPPVELPPANDTYCVIFEANDYKPLPNPLPSSLPAGFYTVDDDITIKQDVSFENCWFRIAPNKKITISSGKSNFTKCHLFACKDLWGGIVANSGTSLTMTGCFIEDAKEAIRSRKNMGELSLSGNDFNRNKIAIMVTGGANITPTIFQGNYFRCDSKLNTGEEATCGIKVNLYSSLAIGKEDVVNTFETIRQGIRVDFYSNVTVSSCRFRNIASSTSKTSGGEGIFINNGSFALVYGLGQDNIANPTFDNCRIGISAKSSAFRVSSAHFNNYNFGILANNETVTRTGIVQDCSFTFIRAIQVYCSGGQYYLAQNHLNLTGFNPDISGGGINVVGSNADCKIDITGNDIVCNVTEGDAMIGVTNCIAAKVGGNTITNNGLAEGILTIGGDKNEFQSNTVSSAGQNSFSNFATPNCVYQTNSSNLSKTGFRFAGACDNTLFACNRMGNHSLFDRDLSVNGTMGPQLNNHNAWNGSKTSAKLTGGNPDDSPFMVDNENAPCTPQNRTAGWFMNNMLPECSTECPIPKPPHKI